MLLFILTGVEAIIKMSLMPYKAAIGWCLFWGIVTAVLAFWMSGLAMQEAIEILNARAIAILEFIEIIIFMAYLFSNGKIETCLEFYPGLMISVPLSILSFWAVRRVTGMDFVTTGIMIGVITAVSLIGIVTVLHRLRIRRSELYHFSILSLILCIITCGII